VSSAKFNAAGARLTLTNNKLLVTLLVDIRYRFIKLFCTV